jgi:hypothetical protein
MTPYFSRLAQRSGGPSPTRGRAGSAGIDAGSGVATSANDGGYREQEQTLSIEAAHPPVVSEASAAGIESPASTARASTDAQVATDAPMPRVGAATATLRAEISAIDPYRNQDETDAAESDAIEQTTVRVSDVPEKGRIHARNGRPRTVAADALGDTAPRDDRGFGDRDLDGYADIDRRRVVDRGESTRPASMPQQRSTVRASSATAAASMPQPAVRGDNDAADVAEESVADAVAAPMQRSQPADRSRGPTVHAAAPQTSNVQEPSSRRSGHGLQVQIGRIELEVIAPQTKTATPPPQPQSAPASAPVRKPVFNPHRHYLRGR